MENASKALIIAGSVLIGIIVISIFVYVFHSTADFASSYETTVSVANVNKFNNRFEKYTGRQDITLYEIISLVNFAKDFNTRNDLSVENGINVQIDNTSYINFSDKKLIEIMSKSDPKITYTYENKKYNETTQIVKNIKFRTTVLKNSNV